MHTHYVEIEYKRRGVDPENSQIDLYYDGHNGSEKVE